MQMQIQISADIRINKKDMDDSMRQWIIRSLTLDNPEYDTGKKYQNSVQKIERYLYLYRTSRKFFWLPRGFLYKFIRYLKGRNISFNIENKTQSVKNKGIHTYPPVSLYPHQERAVDKLIRARQGLIVMPCGSGKTRTAIECIRRIGGKALVIVGSTFLITQWQEYLDELFSVQTGLIQQKTFDIQDITIATIQTLTSMHKRGELTQEFFNTFTTIVVDEVHHVSTESYQNIVNNFTAQYRIGTTATTERKDGLTRLIYYTMGQRVIKISTTQLAKENYLIPPEIRTIRTDFNMVGRARNFNTLTNRLIEDDKRNKLIAANLLSSRNNYNLILSSRIKHLENIAKIFKSSGYEYEIITSKINQARRNEIIERMQKGELHYIFATQLADEGLDIPILDRIHLVFPGSSAGRLEQRIGRVQRYYPNKEKPIVYDYLDDEVTILRNMYNKRYNVYRALGLINIKKKKFATQGRFKLF